ncbi:hypothetical protein MIC448_710002 [Microbacterium sp. C448]|nr:hypothetical protein MIC448_710002 [Microbacterium sp. C448]
MAVVSGAGTRRVSGSPESSHRLDRSPSPHQIEERWKSSSGLAPTGEANAQAASVRNMSRGTAIFVIPPRRMNALDFTHESYLSALVSVGAVAPVSRCRHTMTLVRSWSLRLGSGRSDLTPGSVRIRGSGHGGAGSRRRHG